MADIVLLDANGTSATYQNVDSITVPRSGGGTATFTTGGGGGTKPAYLLNNGDTVTTLYFNVDYNVGAILPYLTYDQTETITGAGLSYCYLGIGHLSAFDLTNLGLSGEYAVAWADENSGTVVPIYATTAVPAFGVTEAGWQVASYTPSSSITVDYTYINPSFFTVMDEIVAQDDIAFGEHGGGGEEEVAVTFYDYDGSIVASYSANEFADLTALPANPTHTGLTAQGWNWTLANAKTYVATYGKLDIGQLYATSDGKTRIYIHLVEGRLAPYLGLAINGTASVDWGDGRSSTVTGTSTSTVKSTLHTYSAAGDYVIAIAVTGSATLLGSSSYSSQVLWKNNTSTTGQNQVYQSAIKKIEIGSGVSIGDYAFRNCYSLTSVTIPSSVTNIGTNAFYNCYALASVTIPSSVTSISDSAFYQCYYLSSAIVSSGTTSIGSHAFYCCRALASVTIPSSVTSIGDYAFNYCVSLTSVAIPSTVTSIESYTFGYCSSLASVDIQNGVAGIGDHAFYECSALASVTIPGSVTSIGDGAFTYCNSLTSLTISSDITSFGSNVFSNCKALTSVVIQAGATKIFDSAFQLCNSLASVTIPSTVTSNGNSAFQLCYALASVTIPSSVTSIGSSAFSGCNSLASADIQADITSLPSSAFSGCSSLASVTIPSSVTSIGSSAFNNCRGLGMIKFLGSTPPTVSNSNAWTGLPTDCKIYVPSAALSTYKGKTNYPSSSTYTYVGY